VYDHPQASGAGAPGAVSVGGTSVGQRRSAGASLTPFERRILELRVRGLSRKEIARDLGLSPQTISNSLTIAKEKLGAHSLMEAAGLLSITSSHSATAPNSPSSAIA